MFKLLIQCL